MILFDPSDLVSTLHTLTLTALEGIPEIQPGDALEQVLLAALERNRLSLRDGDVVALCQKIVSKAENRFVELDTVEPSAQAQDLAQRCGKDARFVEVVLRQSTRVVRCVKDVLIVRHQLGFVVANAGVDQSNIEGAGSRVLLLPEQPDRSAAGIRDCGRDAARCAHRRNHHRQLWPRLAAGCVRHVHRLCRRGAAAGCARQTGPLRPSAARHADRGGR